MLCCYQRPAIFLINSSTIKARCSPDHAMLYTENGTYTAVRRRAPHHCTRSPPEAMLQNRGILSAATCVIEILVPSQIVIKLRFLKCNEDVFLPDPANSQSS
jgi:hypothetical protein